MGSAQYHNDQLKDSFFNPNSSRTRSRRSFSTGALHRASLSPLLHAL